MYNLQQKNSSKPKILPESVRIKQAKVRKRRLFFSVFLTVLIAFAAVGCSAADSDSTDPLCGKWDLDGTTVYVFDGNGSGALELPENKYEFRYEINGETVSIDFADDKIQDISYEFAVNSNELTLLRKEKTDTITYKLKMRE